MSRTEHRYLLADYHNMNDDTGTTGSLQSEQYTQFTFTPFIDQEPVVVVTFVISFKHLKLSLGIYNLVVKMSLR